jgi:hypothetical protein
LSFCFGGKSALGKSLIWKTSILKEDMGFERFGETSTYQGILAFSRSSAIQEKEINQHKNGQSFVHSEHGQE